MFRGQSNYTGIYSNIVLVGQNLTGCSCIVHDQIRWANGVIRITYELIVVQ